MRQDRTFVGQLQANVEEQPTVEALTVVLFWLAGTEVKLPEYLQDEWEGTLAYRWRHSENGDLMQFLGQCRVTTIEELFTLFRQFAALIGGMVGVYPTRVAESRNPVDIVHWTRTIGHQLTDINSEVWAGPPADPDREMAPGKGLRPVAITSLNG
jgi:hypothetical protein